MYRTAVFLCRCGWLAIALGAVVAIPVLAQSPTEVPILIQPVRASARAAGLAESYVADAFDVGAMYWNPAALSYLQDFNLQVNHSQEQLIKSEDENVSIPFYLRRTETIAFGISVNHVGYLDNQSTVYRALQFGYDVAYSREIAPTLSAGVSIQALYAHSAASQQWGVSSLFGLFYYPTPEVSYGVSVGGIGQGIEYYDKIDTASNQQIQHTTFLRQAYTPRYLQIGATLRYPTETRDPDIVIAFANEKIFNQSGLTYKAAMEYFPWGFIALRGGYIVTPTLAYAQFGWGFRSQRIHLDFSISPSAETDQAIQVSLLIGLWKSPSTQR